MDRPDDQPLTLAKPFELLHADDAYVPLLDADQPLPTLGKHRSRPSFSMYCVDPRDGYARFLFARPAAPDASSAGDPRDPYGVAVVAVDPPRSRSSNDSTQLYDRRRPDRARRHDVEPHAGLAPSRAARPRVRAPLGSRMKQEPYTGRDHRRSNVVMDGTAGIWFRASCSTSCGVPVTQPDSSVASNMYYQPCSICERTIAEINLTGCTRCAHAPSPASVLGAQEAHRRRVAEARQREAGENAALAAKSALAQPGITFDPPLDRAPSEEGGDNTASTSESADDAASPRSCLSRPGSTTTHESTRSSDTNRMSERGPNGLRATSCASPARS